MMAALRHPTPPGRGPARPVLLLLLSGAPRAAQASLIGDSVTCTGVFAFTCDLATAMIGGGSEFTLRFFSDPRLISLQDPSRYVS
jgi:hypothetical protein